jgi:enoyl-CoA hydratase/carnithine racemase
MPMPDASTVSLERVGHVLLMDLVQQVVEPGQQLDRAKQVAQVIAAQSPPGVQGTLRKARLAWRDGAAAAAAANLLPEIQALMDTEDATEGIKAFIERHFGVFSGR